MATYTKPGVYIEESLTPNLPVASTASPSTAVFIGYADRGPTQVVNSNVSGLPTLVTSWSDFINTFSFGSNINTFTGIPATTLLTPTLSTSSNTVTVASGANNLRVGSTVALSGAAVGALSTTATSVVTAVLSDTSFNISALPSVAGTAQSIIATPSSDLKYAVKTFFDNGGGQAYILRDVNTDATAATTTIRDSANSVSATGSVTFDAYTPNFGNKSLTITAATGTPFANYSAGQVVSISGVASADSGYQFLNANSWVVKTSSNTVLTIFASPASAIATSAGTTYSTAAPLVITGGGQSSTNALKITANSPGAWGNNIWVSATPNNNYGYFDLTVYYSTTAAADSTLSKGNIVERFLQLSMDPTNARYVINVVKSNWITLTDGGSSATGINRLPAFTGTWKYTSGSANLTSTGAFQWVANGFTNSGPVAVRLSSTTSANVQSAVAAGVSGSTVRTNSDLISRLDSINGPLVINWANNSYTTDVNALLTYASDTRGDSFVIIDTAGTSLSAVLGSTTDVGIGSYSGNINFGAAYYPDIVIADPASSTGKTLSVAPGGAVTAIYTNTDNSRGVFKAPAGINSRIRSAVSVPALSNSDFTSVSQNNVNLNIIRFVPGNGICVMGARTLSNGYSDMYVPVRRTVSYLGSTLKNITQFAVFEPNDQNLWNKVDSIVSKFLNDFWRSGGLFGATASQAFYVKCDDSINTTGSISAGELHIEVGVALQRPAEFVVIRIGQLDGGATVTTSL